MPDKYCTSSKCGAKTSYVAKPPRFCSACGLEFSKAFVIPPEPQSQSTQASVEPIRKPSVKRPRPPQDPDYEDYAQPDEQEVKLLARELAASIQGDITIESNSAFGVKLGDLLKNPDKFGNVGQRGQTQSTESE